MDLTTQNKVAEDKQLVTVLLVPDKGEQCNHKHPGCKLKPQLDVGRQQVCPEPVKPSGLPVLKLGGLFCVIWHSYIERDRLMHF